MRFKTLFVFASVIIFLAGCNPSKRAQRHVRKAIALDPSVVTVDTIRDTIHAKRVDTLVSLPFGRPTVITKDGITLTLRPVSPMDVVPVIEVTAETKQEIREIPVERIKYVTKPATFWQEVKEILLWVLLGLAIIVIFKVIIEKLLK